MVLIHFHPNWQNSTLVSSKIAIVVKKTTFTNECYHTKALFAMRRLMLYLVCISDESDYHTDIIYMFQHRVDPLSNMITINTHTACSVCPLHFMLYFEHGRLETARKEPFYTLMQGLTKGRAEMGR